MIAVDLHFGHVRAFEVYEATADGVTHLEQRGIDQYCKDDDDRATRMKGILQVIGDCKGVLIARIGPVPKEMLAAAGLDAADDYRLPAGRGSGGRVLRAPGSPAARAAAGTGTGSGRRQERPSG